MECTEALQHQYQAFVGFCLSHGIISCFSLLDRCLWRVCCCCCCYHFVTSSFSPSLTLSSLVLDAMRCEKADFCITLSNPFQWHISKITTFPNLCIYSFVSTLVLIFSLSHAAAIGTHNPNLYNIQYSGMPTFYGNSIEINIMKFCSLKQKLKTRRRIASHSLHILMDGNTVNHVRLAVHAASVAYQALPCIVRQTNTKIRVYQKISLRVFTSSLPPCPVPS